MSGPTAPSMMHRCRASIARRSCSSPSERCAMADYLILRRREDDPDSALSGADAWEISNLVRDKTADTNGETAAIRESYRGPGRYGIVRIDNARTVVIEATPKLTDDPSPQF